MNTPANPEEGIKDIDPLPTAERISTLLGSLLSRSVTVEKGSAVVALDRKSIVALYACNEGALRAVFISDLDFAINAGSALSLFPPAIVAKNLKEGQLTEESFDNFKEILNVCTRLVRESMSLHLSLNGIFLPTEPLPNDVASRFSLATARRDFNIQVEGYGSGKVAVLAF
ncbi:MAG: hypothetical protein LLH30_04380 [Candidatus Manganitrophus sp. SA1]|nr:hypothetical protein [Candidatus Manganitrophus morganii]